MAIKFVPIDFDYIDINNREIIRIFGRTNEGKRICVLDSLSQYFWAIPRRNTDIKEYAEKISKISIRQNGRDCVVIKTEIKDKKYLEKPVKAVQIFVANHKDISTIVEAVKRMPETEEKKEIDFNFITRYLIEKKIKPLELHSLKGRQISREELKEMKFNIDVDLVIEASEIKIIDEDYEFAPRMLAFDIESSDFGIGKGQIIMVSVYGNKFEKTITTKKFSAEKNVVFAKNEKELIEEFIKTIKSYKPDCIVGYFSDGFDMPYFRARAEKNSLKLNLGIDNSNVSFIKGAIQSSKITGIVHMDLYKFINNTFAYILQSETYSLNDVAKELLGEEKLDIDIGKITKQMQNGREDKVDWKKYYLYNLQDSALTFKLAVKLWHNIAELSKFVGEPLFNVSRASYSQLVENYILHNLNEFNEIAPNRPTHDKIAERRNRPKYTGAYVFQPEAGLYENIAVFDFRSFWPSIISSFNLSPASLQTDKKNAYQTPELEMNKEKTRFYFSKEKSFIPILLQRLLDERKKIKEQKKKVKNPILDARDYNMKTLSNATYGYLGFFGARYYSPESSASATAISRFYIHDTIEKIKKQGYRVIYADTDSVYLLLEGKDEKDALNMLEEINKNLPGTMELEVEDFYKRGIFVTKRTGEFGAKKKYALLSKSDKIKIRGFETIRRDWCDLAKEVQDEILNRILKEGNATSSLAYVQKIIKELKEKKVAIEKLVIRTQLKKGIDEYENIGPHVTIAKEMFERGIPVSAGTLIEYVIAESEGKSKLIRDKAKLPEDVKEGDYDIDYYVHNQIMHAVGNIFEVFGISMDELAEGKKQKKLGEF